jgi:acetoin utilization protein AcuB
MYVRDIMTSNVVTVPSDTPVADAAEIMQVHKIERLPIVDKGKLVGIVNKDRLLRVSPSPASPRSIIELTSVLSKMKVKDIMVKDVVTASPDMTVEKAVALAQFKKVGALPVMQDDKIVGIVTTDDFFYKILNPLLGIGEPGTRIKVHGCTGAKDILRVWEVIAEYDPKVITVGYIPHPEHGIRDLTIHIDTEAKDVNKMVEKLANLNYLVEVRER